MTKSQQKIIEALKDNGWLTAMDIAERTGIRENHIRAALKTKFFLNLKRGVKETKDNNRIKYIKVYAYVKPNQSAIEEAMNLAKQHTGIFGQLHWAANHDKKILLVEEA
jgi:DeoR/GlpR family transcriptional regulator of sugar metabolism